MRVCATVFHTSLFERQIQESNLLHKIFELLRFYRSHEENEILFLNLNFRR